MAGLRIRALAVILAAIGCATAHAAEDVFAPPTLANPAGALAPFTCPPPIHVAGVDLILGGIPVAGETPTVPEGAKLTLNVHWIPITARRDSVDLTWTVRGYGPSVSGTFRLFHGRDYSIGGRYVTPAPLALPPLRHVGLGALTLNVSCDESGGATRLYRVPLLVEPALHPSNVDGERIADHFGTEAVRAEARFRLAPGASIEFDVPTGPYAAIGLVSALSWFPNFAQGQPVARVVTIAPDGSLGAEHEIRAGETTALSDYDQFRPGRLNHDKLPVVVSRPEGTRRTWDGRRFQTHLYRGVVPFDRPVETSRLRFTYAADRGVLDVAEVVLIPAE